MFVAIDMAKRVCIGAIIKMQQKFAGADNLNLLYPSGNVGTRKEGGKNAAGERYVYVKPESYFSHIFRSEDDPLLVLTEDDGKIGEPELMLPTIPLIAINGSLGIGIGYSTFIPNHDEFDCINVIEGLIRRILGEHVEIEPIKPYYRGFVGELTVVERKRKPKNDTSNSPIKPKRKRKINTVDDLNTISLDEANKLMIDENTKHTMVTKGIFDYVGADIQVSELPIGYWDNDYNKELHRMKDEKLLTSVEQNGKPGVVGFIIRGFKDLPATHKKLDLVKSVGLNNMVILNEKQMPVRYDNVMLLIETFFNWRLGWYLKRKEYQLKEIRREIDDLKLKLKLLTLIRGGKIKPVQSKAGLHSEMKQYNFDPSAIKSVKLTGLTDDHVAKIDKKITQLETKYTQLNHTTHQQLWLNDLDELKVVLNKRPKYSAVESEQKGKGKRRSSKK